MLLRSFTLVTATLLGIAAPLAAQGWGRLPNGEWGYTHNLTTSAVFSCVGAAYFYPGSGCSVAGNSLTLFSAASSMTISFTASTQSIVATSSRDRDYVMGTLTKTFTGAPFTLPQFASPNGPMFSFGLLLASTAPISTSGRMLFSYTALTGTSLPFDCCEVPDYTVLQLTPPPAPLTYSRIVYDTFRGVNITFDTSPQTITARVGLVPEPRTYVMMATGLIALALTARRRRSS